ncbi:MAG: tRNA (N6-isopentenyl adenosine(37)-C2)-methylthiotransferase MiaB [Spirochaetaceae bacterium]|jgi:tRNA-2-methylthio-N6-dimethylallyladenosine synthase|nr:tRNA (N6-isopentenyl adenosine(37)-C2)-methylthiotransferase MiaB [Spirochaetaceae bacterium]
METEKTSYYFETYGCQMNFAESDALKITLNDRGWSETDNVENALLLVINTCSVRETAERRVFGRLAHYTALKKERRRRQNPLFVLVCGCMASRLGGKLIKNGADFVMETQNNSIFTGILEKIEAIRNESRTPQSTLQTILQSSPHKTLSNETLHDEDPDKTLYNKNSRHFSFAPIHHKEGSFRAFVPIMHGCDNFCSYCIVPYTRGREICRDPAEIVAEIKTLADRGVREITLLGQNVNSYINGKIDFPALLEIIARETEGTTIKRARFLSSHPKDLSLRTIQVMAKHPVFCRHLHLCVQHGSNRILSAMNRRYTRESFIELTAAIRAAMPEITLSTDILVGFPGETEEDFEEALTLMERIRFLYSYMYHYNPREGTAAFDLPERVPPEIKTSRLKRVIDLQMRHTAELLQSRIGDSEKALVDGISHKNSKELVCRTEHDEMIVAEGDTSLIGTIAAIQIDGLSGNTLRGHFIKDI